MNKNQELAVLDEAIKKLGHGSYLGPWLAGIREEVERAILSDYYPELSLAAAEAQCAALRKQGAEELAEARAKITREHAEASRRVQQTNDSIRRIEAAVLEAKRTLSAACY